MNKTNVSTDDTKPENNKPQRRNGRSDAPLDEKLSVAKVKEISKNLGDQLETQMHDRPYVVLGAVAGVGFVAGSLLGSRLGQIAIALAGGYLVRNLINQAAGPGGVQRVVKEGLDKLTQHERTNG